MCVSVCVCVCVCVYREREKEREKRDTLSETAVSSRTVVTFVTWLISRTSFLELENCVLGINHVTNVTTVLDETATSDRVSR